MTQHLKDEYSALKTEYEKAVFESKVWNSRDPDIQTSSSKVYGIAGYVPPILGVSPSSVKRRRFLLGLGPDTNCLWDRIDQDNMPLTTAVDIARRAKIRAKSVSSSFPEALSKELENYGGEGTNKRIHNGRVYFARNPVSGRNNDSPFVSGPFWETLVLMVRNRITTETRGLTPTEARSVLRSLEADLFVAISDARRRIGRAKKSGNEIQDTVHSDVVIDACNILKLNPPLYGHPVDLVEANRQRRKLARSYHPDSHGGSEHTRDLFHEVMRAYSILENYNDNLIPEQRKEANV